MYKSTLNDQRSIKAACQNHGFRVCAGTGTYFNPRKYPFVFEMAASEPSVTHALMGIGQQQDGMYSFTDGVNEAGLACATLYFPGYAHYSEGISADKTNLASYEVVGWLLANCATIAEAKEAVPRLNIVNTPAKLFGVVTPLHWIVTDKNGATIVIEPMESGLVIHDNPLGVMSNSPDFNWHLTNIRNYIGINPFKIEPLIIEWSHLCPLWQWRQDHWFTRRLHSTITIYPSAFWERGH